MQMVELKTGGRQCNAVVSLGLYLTPGLLGVLLCCLVLLGQRRYGVSGIRPTVHLCPQGPTLVSGCWQDQWGEVAVPLLEMVLNLTEGTVGGLAFGLGHPRITLSVGLTGCCVLCIYTNIGSQCRQWCVHGGLQGRCNNGGQVILHKWAESPFVVRVHGLGQLLVLSVQGRYIGQFTKMFGQRSQLLLESGSF